MKKEFHFFVLLLFIASLLLIKNVGAQTNIALGKSVTAQATTAGSPANIVDGDTATKWQSAATWSQWIQVDLGATYTANTIIVRFDSGATFKGYPLTYDIQVSDNGTTWTTFDSVRSNAQATNIRANLSVTGKYIRLQLLGRTGTYYVIKELEIYQDPNSNVVTYPLASCFVASETRSVTVIQNNVEYTVPVRKFVGHGTTFYDYAQFSFSGPVTVKVKNKAAAISGYQISPNSYAMQGTTGTDSTLSFTLSKSRYVQVVLNNQTDRPLFILADTLESDIPPASGSGIYNIALAPYNANNTGASNVTTIVQKAINDASSAGGGTVYIPTGVFRLSKITAQSNVNIYLQGGAVLMGLNSDQGATSTRMIEGNGVSNVKIYGRGTIWCNGAAANNNQETDVSGSVLIGGLRFTNTNNTTLDGITFSESTIWTVGYYNGAKNITVKNTKIMNATDWNWNDGYDICGGHDAGIDHCFYVGSDDAACTKVYAGYPVYNVHFNDLVTKSDKSSGFKAGNQAYDDLHDITIENFRVISCMRGFNFDHWYGTGIWGGNIIVRNFWIDEVSGTQYTTGACSYIVSPFRFVICDSENSGVGPISDIWVENIYYPGNSGLSQAYLNGYSNDYKISNITFKDCQYKGIPVTGPAAGNIKEVQFTSNIQYIYGSGTLPVSLTGFTALAKNVSAVLRWRTFTETNNSHFDVQRSADGKVFTTIGSVVGVGNSSVQRDYNFTDPFPMDGTNYYRLAQVDLNSEITYSEVRKLNFAGKGTKFKIFPNPTKGFVTIQYKTMTDLPVSIRIYDLGGRLVKTVVSQKIFPKDVDNIIQFNLADELHSANGEYLLQMSTNENIIGLNKIILAR